MGRGRPKKGSTSTSQPQSNQLAQQVTQIEEDERSTAENLNPRFGEKPTATDEETTILMEKKIDDGQQKLWVDVVNENRNPAKGMPLKYFAPQIVNGEVEVMIEDEDIESELKFCDITLIMYVLGADMSMHSVKHFMMQNWNFVPLPDMYYHDEGYFLLRFSSHREREEVMMRGPYTIRNMPAIEFEWKPEFCPKFQKIGHKCGEPKREEKQWRPRAKAINTGKQQIQVTTVPKVTPAKQPEGSTSYDHGPLLFQVQPSKEWITPTKNANERGKDHKKTTTPNWLRCTNGFDALEVSKNSRALDDPGPC
ncbi:hypothetical protein HKD37_19G052907 [Glycine soja]